MRRVGIAGLLLLLPACATGRGGEEFVGRDRSAGDALRCAMQAAGQMGYQLVRPPQEHQFREGGFRGERWLGPRETGSRSLGVLTVSVRERSAGETHLRVDGERFEETGAGSSGRGSGLGGPSLPEVVGGRRGPTAVDSTFGRGAGRAARGGLKRVSPGPVLTDAHRIRTACSESAAGASAD